MKLIGNATDTQARREIWISFRGLLQAYLAAGLAGSAVPQALIAEPKPDSLQIVGTARSVQLELEPATGQGYWVIHGKPEAEDGLTLNEGAFRLGLDAQFEWSGKPGRMEMDAVAEALAMLVLDAGE